jgi:hypothetical protein
MAYSQRGAISKNCTNCTHGCAGYCCKGKTYHNERDIPIHTPTHTPTVTTPYQTYLMYGTVQDQRHPKVNALMKDNPTTAVPRARITQEYYQKESVDRFLAGMSPGAAERRKGGIISPFFR